MWCEATLAALKVDAANSIHFAWATMHVVSHSMLEEHQMYCVDTLCVGWLPEEALSDFGIVLV